MDKKFCDACGMPMQKAEDFGNGDITMETCVYCTSEDGNIKSCEEIFYAGVEWACDTFAVDQNLAVRWVRRNMRAQPYGQTIWKDQPCLKGEESDDEEWYAIFSKLSSSDNK